MTYTEIEKYSAKQLLPFTGNIQIIKSPFARALSSDGITWQIQTICEAHQQQWNINENHTHKRRYIIYGTWSENQKLSRFPIDPTLDVPSEKIINEHLTMEIEENLSLVPFPPNDLYELWLLDKEHYLPVALLATSISEEHILDSHPVNRWRSRSGSESKFPTSSYTYQNNPFLLLEQYINKISCKPICMQWFYRQADRSGLGLNGNNIPSELEGRLLNDSEFPELLLNSSSKDTAIDTLLSDYIQWLSPRLLTLHHLTTDTRLMLESAAQYQPAEVLRFHKLYPAIINYPLITKTLVEAKLRATIK